MATRWIEVTFGGRRLGVEYDYTPPQQGVHTLRNGDPGWPDEPEEFYITRASIRLPDAQWLDITDLLELQAGKNWGEDPLTLLAYAAMHAETEEMRHECS